MKEASARGHRGIGQKKAAADPDARNRRTRGASTWVDDSPRVVAQRQTIQRIGYAGPAVVQRMTVLSSSNGEDVCRFLHDEPQPDKDGHYRGDGYSYTLRGSDAKGNLFHRRLISYQNAPTTTASASSSSSSQGYGTLVGSSGGGQGGPITANPSKHFPTEGALDLATYDRDGYSRIIGPEELAELPTAGTLSLLAEGKKKASSLVSSVRGADYETEHAQRERMTTTDPRVLHYLATHKARSLTESGATFAVSLATGGLSSIGQKAASGTNFTALSVRFAKEASRVEKENEALMKTAHSSADLRELGDKSLIDALNTLSTHFAGRVVTTGLSAIPLHIGTVIGALDTARQTTMGHGEGVEDALNTIILQASQERPHVSALRVADILGVPRELLTASGGIEVLKTRL